MSGIMSMVLGARTAIAAAVDEFFNRVTLLLPGNGTNGAQNNTFLDSSSNNFTITRNGGNPGMTQGTFSPFSQTGWSNYFNGSTDFLDIGSGYPSALALGSSNFTIEGWVYLQAATKQLLLGNLNDGNATCTFFVILNNTTASARYEIKLGSTAYNLGTGTLPTNQWVHVCLMRSGTSVYLFENGSQIGATQTYSGSISSSTNQMRVGGAIGDQYPLSGYASNLRMVIGTAVYSTSGFSVPTSPLTAITNTALLTCNSNRFRDESSNAIAIALEGTPSVQAFSPFAPTAAYSAATNGGSGYFDGTGDYVSCPSDTGAPFDFGTGNFTIEGWFYATGTGASATNSRNLWGISQGSGTSQKMSIYIDANANLTVDINGSAAITTGAAYGNTNFPGRWVHLALVRSGTGTNQTVLYVNGASAGTATVTANFTAFTNPFNVGYVGEAFLSPWLGYIANFRVVKGTAVYTGAFTPPIAPLSTSGAASASAYSSTTNVNTSFAASNTSLLCNFTNAGITDATAKNDLETVGNAQISTTQSKFGGASISFDGTGDWLLLPHTVDQMLGTAAFTIEMWIYRNSSGTYGLVGKGTGTTGWLVSLNSSNQVVFTYGSSTITSTGTISATTWTYIAVVREGTGTNQTKIYISGSNDGTGTVSTDFNQTNAMYVGADRTGGSAFNGYIDDLRITKGYARTIATPSSAFALQ